MPEPAVVDAPAAPASQEPPATPAAPATPPAVPSAPPWGTPEQFDPDKAWSLIEGLRADKEKLAARPTLTPEQQTQLAEYQRLVEASQTEAERQAKAVAQATRDAETARADAMRYKAAATHQIPAEYHEFLTGSTDEEVAEKATKIAALLAAQAAVPPTTVPPTRPVEQLRPGATPAGTQSEDDVVFAALFGPPKQ